VLAGNCRRRDTVVSAFEDDCHVVENTHDGQHHVVDIVDEDAAALVDLYLPPDGTHVSAEDLRAAIARLTAAANERKRARRARA
jgi:hypothetical protein